MKKTVFLFLFCCLAVLGMQAQTAPNPCPKGQQAVGFAWHIDRINFHKPRTDCESGFGFCIQGHWEVICRPNGSPQPPFAVIESDKVNFWYQLKEGKLELHLPIALKQDPEFAGEDMSVFYIEEDFVQLKNTAGDSIGWLKAGGYAVKETDKELIILIDVK